MAESSAPRCGRRRETLKCPRTRRSTGSLDSDHDEQHNDSRQQEEGEGTDMRQVPRPDSWNQDGGDAEGRKRHRVEDQEHRRQLQTIHALTLGSSWSVIPAVAGGSGWLW